MSSFLIVTLFVGVMVVIIYIYFKYQYQYWKNKNVPQMNPTFPFGDMASVIFRKQNMADKIKEIYDKMKPLGYKYVGLYFFSRKVFLPLDPILIKRILVQDFHYFHDRGIYYDEENDPLSAHLFSLSGSKWKILRSKLTPAFTSGKIKYMFNTILDCGIQMQQILEEMSLNRTTVEIKEILARYTTDVIGSCAFGIDCNSLRNPNAEFRLMGKRAFTQTITDELKMIVIRSFPQLAKLFKFGVFSPIVMKFFENAVKETIYYRQNNNIKRNDFLQLLIELKNNGHLENDISDNVTNTKPLEKTNITIDEAAAQAFIFFLAGFETTSTTITFSLFEIATNTFIQNKIRKEINHIVDKYKGKFSYDALMEMHYLESVILESMRKYPPAPIFLRKCTKEYKIPDTNVIIESGFSILIPAFGLHHDPDYFPQSQIFNPDRFKQENKSTIWDYTYIPFGDGPRICIGMKFAMIQIKIALIIILKNFKISLNNKTKLPLKMETKGIILSPNGGIWLNLKKIKN